MTQNADETSDGRKLQRLSFEGWHFVMCVEVLSVEAGEEIRPFRRAPEMAETDGGLVSPSTASLHEQTYGRANADAFAVLFGRKDGWIGFAFGRQFAGFAAVAVHAVEPDGCRIRQGTCAHDHERRIAQIGEIRNERHHAPPAISAMRRSARRKKRI